MKYFTKASIWLFLILILRTNYGNAEDTNESPKSDTDNNERFEKSGKIIAKVMLGVGGKFIPFFEAALSLWDGIDLMVDSLESSDPQAETNKKIGKLAEKINKMGSDMKYYYTDLDSSLRKISKITGELNPKLKDVYRLVSKVERKFERMNKTLQFNFTSTYIEEKLKQIRVDLPDTLDEMVFQWTENRDYTSAIDLLRDKDLKSDQVCSRRASILQMMYNHYQSVHGALVKGLWLLILAYGMDMNLKQSDKQIGIQIELAAHLDRVNEITNLFRNYMVGASRDMWRCDADNAVEGVTYERFGRAFQKYLINMRNVQPYNTTDKDDCPGSCEDIPGSIYELQGTFWSLKKPKNNQNHVFYPANKEFQRRHMHIQPNEHDCGNGFLKNCKTVKDDTLKVCTAQSNAIERYTYISSNHWIYGSNSSCPSDPQVIQAPEPRFRVKVSSSSGFVSGVRYRGELQQQENRQDKCFYCMCTCEYNPPLDYLDILEEHVTYKSGDTDRYIDLRPVTADRGHVMTGVRLKKVSETYTFYLQIKQAKLLPNGRVGKAAWKDIEIHYRDEPTTTDGVVSNAFGKYREGIDYHTIKSDNTIMYLDNELHPNKDQVLTGVKFQVYANESGKIHLRLVSQLSNFIVSSGRIRNSEWHPKNVTKIIGRNRVTMKELDIPTRYNGKNNAIIGSCGYVELVNSGLEADVGQNVLPFIDIQPVDTNPPVPLTGVGLYHRGFLDSGGYLGLNVTIIDIVDYLPTKDALMHEREKLLKMTINSTDNWEFYGESITS